jgi:hypothetical protein
MGEIKNEKDAVCKALYLEFRKQNYTYQIIAVPATVSIDNSKVIPPMFMSRRITSWSPRKNWAFSTSPVVAEVSAMVSRDAMGAITQITKDEAEKYASQVVQKGAGLLFDNISTRGYTLYKQPITVEASYKDISLMNNSSTPADLYRRILRSRESFGFGAEVVAEPVVAS